MTSWDKKNSMGNVGVYINNVLLGKKWYTIYHQLPVVKGTNMDKQTPLLINQTMGKGHLWYIILCNGNVGTFDWNMWT